MHTPSICVFITFIGNLKTTSINVYDNDFIKLILYFTP